MMSLLAVAAVFIFHDMPEEYTTVGTSASPVARLPIQTWLHKVNFHPFSHTHSVTPKLSKADAFNALLAVPEISSMLAEHMQGAAPLSLSLSDQPTVDAPYYQFDLRSVNPSNGEERTRQIFRVHAMSGIVEASNMMNRKSAWLSLQQWKKLSKSKKSIIP